MWYCCRDGFGLCLILGGLKKGTLVKWRGFVGFRFSVEIGECFGSLCNMPLAKGDPM